MRALRLLAWGEPPELVEVPVPEPARRRAAAPRRRGRPLPLGPAHHGRPSRQLALSASRSRSATRWSAPWWRPATMPQPDGWAGGRPSTASGRAAGAGSAAAGRENYCFALTGPIGGGIGRDGGLADFMLVPCRAAPGAGRRHRPADGGAPHRRRPDRLRTPCDTHRDLLPGATGRRDRRGRARPSRPAVAGRVTTRRARSRSTRGRGGAPARDRARRRRRRTRGRGPRCLGWTTATAATAPTWSSTSSASHRDLAAAGASAWHPAGASSWSVRRGSPRDRQGARACHVAGVSRAPFWGTRADLVAVVGLAAAGRIWTPRPRPSA